MTCCSRPFYFNSRILLLHWKHDLFSLHYFSLFLSLYLNLLSKLLLENDCMPLMWLLYIPGVVSLQKTSVTSQIMFIVSDVKLSLFFLLLPFISTFSLKPTCKYIISFVHILYATTMLFLCFHTATMYIHTVDVSTHYIYYLFI